MCIGGGGSGDSGIAQRAEDRALAEQQRVKDAIAKVNTMFGVGDSTESAANKAARDRIYGGIESSVNDLNTNTLNTEFANAGREVNFDAARRGLFGGSAYADQLATLADKRNDGLLKITDAAASAANDARAADEKTRLGLAANITNGLDESTAISSASNQMDANATAARTAATASALSGFFDTVLNNLNRSAQQQGITNAWQKYGGSAMPRQAVNNGSLYR